jgi:hypothetical protein
MRSFRSAGLQRYTSYRSNVPQSKFLRHKKWAIRRADVLSSKEPLRSVSPAYDSETFLLPTVSEALAGILYGTAVFWRRKILVKIARL